MPNDILYSPGRFWPTSLEVPQGHFAPAQSVTGRLRIVKSGQAHLELDSIIDVGSGSPVGRIIERSPVDGSVSGFLFDGNKRVWLSALVGGGGSLGGAGPIRETFVANRSLVSTDPLPAGENPRFRWLDLPLAGYEEWVGRGRISVKQGHRRITAEYRKPPRRRWRSGRLSVELVQRLEGSAGEDRTELNWQDAAYLRIGSGNHALTIDELIDRAGRVEDLLVLLADCDRRLRFPLLRTHRLGTPARLYYARSGVGEGEGAKWHKAWARFDACSDTFGEIVDTWLRAYDVHGAGVHLYLGNRRGHVMYPEHRFASLIWGLEALHRSLHIPKDSPKQAEKVRRILGQIEKPKDREWAARFLPEESEPSLAARLMELFTSLSISLNKAQLNAFCQRCADRRNDLSHFGGPREVRGYNSFVIEIAQLSAALDLLYHALILQIARVPDWVIERRIVNGRKHPVRTAATRP